MSAGDLYHTLKDCRLIGDESLVLARQVRFPRSKKRRIRRKWGLRRENNEFTPMPDVFYGAESKTVIAHPATIAELRRRIEASAKLVGATYP